MRDVLSQLAIAAIAHDHEFLGKARFAVSQTGHTYFYDLAPISASYVLSQDDRYGQPLEALIRIESLRRDFGEAVPAEKFWVAPLDEAQQAVHGCVDELESPRSESDSPDAQQQCSISIEKKFNSLETAIREYGALHGLKLINVQNREPLVGYRVIVKIEPPKAQVHIMALLEYKKYLYTKTPAEQYQWNDILAAENFMIGWYHYRADWPADLNGPEEGDFEITKPGTITFRPKSK